MKKIISAQRVISLAQEKRDIAESVLLRLCANWEKFVDEHLVDCLNADHSRLDSFLGLTIPSHPSKALCTALVFGDSYRDFSSIGQLKGFSKRLLPDSSNPFLQITPTQAKRIDEIYKIRNYLSHYSAKSKRVLHRLYEDEYGMNNFIQPGQFLLAYGGRRLNAYFDTFQSTSERMKAWY
jgi:hypothetical protein